VVITSEDVESVLGPRPWKSREDEIIEANEALNTESDETKKKHSPRKKTAKTDTYHETTEDIELEVEIEEPIETTETAATTEAATETTESQEKES
jgi:hypothetical protein